jgi:hypothetical protein
MPFQKGKSGNPTGRNAGRPKRPPQERSDRLRQMMLFDLREAARKMCPEALEVVARCMRSEDEKVALMASKIMMERGYGLPEQHADLNVNHSYVVAPEVLSESEWVKLYASGVAKRPEPPTRLLDPAAEAPPDTKDKLN